jgi:hypothetical protein
VKPNGPGEADPSQFWFVPGYYGDVLDPNKNSDTLQGGPVLDGGAGFDLLVGTGSNEEFYVSGSYRNTYDAFGYLGGGSSQNITTNDAVLGGGGNDTVVFTDSDYLWWSGHEEGATLEMHGYILGSEDNAISNLTLQMGAPTARNGVGNSNSRGNDHFGWFEELGSNLIVGNEFDNILNGGGVGGDNNVGGFDTLTGGGGKDCFVVRGYTDARNNEWDPQYNSSDVWLPQQSTYTDSDFVLISDFTARDIIDLGSTQSFVIGRAPSYIGENNLRLPNIAPDSTNFGIFRLSNNSGNPDLVAHVRTANGLTLNTSNLGSAIDPSVAGDGSRGIFYAINGVQFLDGTNVIPGANLFDVNLYDQKASTASLPSLINSLAT